ncbi:MAG: isocitrate/isopropylmalate dehydrogenase family protein [Chloroflexaceae bacterium]|nr:isocitrate/isopropylmalate dehydrogenase family protein [Chloroflexaceae bacterium]
MQLCMIAGDGIGGEVMTAAQRLLATLAPELEIVEAPAGWGTFQDMGVSLPTGTLALARQSDAVLFGAAGSPSYPVEGYRSPIVALRRELDTYANIRPTRSLPREKRSVDLVVVRENTEDLYAGRERLEDNGDTAITERVITRRASERIARSACEVARDRARTRPDRPAKLTIVHKANVIRAGDGLFRGVALEVARAYPDITVEEMLVDVAAMRLAQSPERFDVLVTTNMFGDILSDVASIHGGGLGLASSASLGTQHAIFEPVHGSAPDIAGQGIANPIATFGCIVMLCDWFATRSREAATAQRYTQRAERLRTAIATVLAHGPYTLDMGGDAATESVTTAVIQQLKPEPTIRSN